MSQDILNVTDDSFQTDVLDSTLPVLVDFWASWCNPCKVMSPILDEIAASYMGKVKVVKLNTDDNKKTAIKYSVRGVPTFTIFKQGKVEASTAGVMSKAKLAEFIDTNI